MPHPLNPPLGYVPCFSHCGNLKWEVIEETVLSHIIFSGDLLLLPLKIFYLSFFSGYDSLSCDFDLRGQ